MMTYTDTHVSIFHLRCCYIAYIQNTCFPIMFTCRILKYKNFKTGSCICVLAEWRFGMREATIGSTYNVVQYMYIDPLLYPVNLCAIASDQVGGAVGLAKLVITQPAQ